MKKKKRIIEKRAASKVHFTVGDSAILEPQGVGDRFKSRFLGWDKGRFVALSVPAAKIDLREFLYAGKPVIVRFIDNTGRICGFQSKIQASIYSPYSMLFLDYPDVVEMLSLRNADRVDCLIPAQVTVKETTVDSTLVNISEGGCLVSLAKDAFSQTQSLYPGLAIRSEFKILVSSDEIHRLDGVIKKVGEAENKMLLAVEFKQISEEIAHQIGSYVDQVVEHLGHTATSLSL